MAEKQTGHMINTRLLYGTSVPHIEADSGFILASDSAVTMSLNNNNLLEY